MRIQVDVYHHFPEGIPWGSLFNKLEYLMSELSDRIAALGTSVDAAIARVQGDVDNLKTQIAALQTKVDAGGAVQADYDALDGMKRKLDLLEQATAPDQPPPAVPGP